MLRVGLVLLLLVVPSPFVAGGISSISHPAPAAPMEFQALAPLATGLTGTSGMQVTGPLAPSTMVSGGLSFNGTDVAGQQSLLNALYTPGSPEYHHFLVGDQFNSQFAPSAALQASLLTYLSAHHLAVTQTSVYLWNLVGTAQDMGAAFGTTYVSAELNGHAGLAPAGPLELPREFRSFASVSGGFQTVNPPVPKGLLRVPSFTVPGFKAVRSTDPLATLTINITSPYIIQYQRGNVAIAFPPTNLNTTWTVTISGGTAPYTVSWHWWDGSVQNSQTSAASLTNFHTYYEPGQADYCDVVVCGNVTVFVNDSASASASYNVGLVPGVSPHTLELYYDISTLLRHGDSGQGTKVGLDEMCDPSYSSSTYLSDLTTFSTDMGLPAPSLQLIGTGASTCIGGSSGWSGETLLDMEAVHASAPNATIVADLADSSITEGDCTWNTLSNGVYLASNSWGTTVATTCWANALSQGQSYQTASGDCGAFTSGTRDEPADFTQGVGVGGTDVYPEPAGTFLREFAWNGTFQSSCSNNEGSTGGYSSVAAPWYQIGMTGFSGTKRGVPDVAAIGGTWFWMIYTGGVTLSAGTSLACPAYTAMLDLMWQYNSSTAAPQGMANYDLYAIAKSSEYGSAMHDIVVGNNIHGTSPPGSGYTTTVGWDPVTGLGSPDVGKLAMYLAAQNGNPSAFGALTAVLASNVSYGAASLAVAFGADATGGTSPLTGYSYAWTFGDGGTASTLDPWTSHAYTTPGTYWASVKVTQGANSGTSNGVRIKVVSLTSGGGGGGGGNPSVSAPTPSRSSTDVGQAAVTFSTTASGGSGTYSSFAWTVSPASAGLSCTASTATASTSCTATAAGAFTVSVTVTDSAGHTSSAATSASFPVYPTPSVSPPSPSSSSITLGQTVTFTSTAGRTGSGSDTYAWTASPATGAGCTSSTTLTYSCTPTAAGTFTATLTVTDSNAGTGTNTSSGVTVSGGSGGNPSVTAPVAAPASVDVGQTVSFTTTPSGGSGAYASFAWTVSPSSGLRCQATTTTGSTPCTSSTAGTYTVSVTVTDSAGHTSAAASSSFVVAPDPSVTAPTPSSSPGTVGTSVSFTTTLSNPGSGGDSYTWSASPTGLGCASASALSISCTPSSAGTYVVTVVAKDSNGGTGTASSASFTVSSSSVGQPLTASATGTPTSGSAPLLVTFTGVGSGGMPGYTYAWNFGDGSPTSALQDPSHTYTSAGSYSAVLVVTDSASHTATSAVPITVSTAPPGGLLVNAQATPNPVSVGATVTFTAQVSGGSPPLTYLWVFGDGAKSTTANATHAFQAAGTYPVSVFVNDSAGHSKQVTIALSVQGGNGGNGGVSGSGPGGLSSMVGPLPIWALLLVAVLLVAAIAAILLTRRRRPLEGAPEAWGPPGAEVAPPAPAPAPAPAPVPVLPPAPPPSPPPVAGPVTPPARPVDEIAPDPFGGRGPR